MAEARAGIVRGVRTLDAYGEDETCAIASALARRCRTGDCIMLQGEVGSGKTTFARAFIRAIGAVGAGEDIVSPTFTLVQAYPLQAGGTLWHFDLYRLRQEGELEEIGLDEALQSGIVLIEWPDMARSRLPEDALEMVITAGREPQARCLRFETACWPLWETRLEGLGKAGCNG